MLIYVMGRRPSNINKLLSLSLSFYVQVVSCFKEISNNFMSCQKKNTAYPYISNDKLTQSATIRYLMKSKQMFCYVYVADLTGQNE